MHLGNRFFEAFLKSWGIILASEIGDKTFFIAAIMAMRNPRMQVRAAAPEQALSRSTNAVPAALPGAP